MDEKKKFDLEDILQEFGEEAESVEEEFLEEAIAEMPIAQEPPLEERLKAFLTDPEDADVKRYVPQTKQADPAMEDQTVVLSSRQIRSAMEPEKAPEPDATIRFEPVREAPAVTSDATVRFEPIHENTALNTDATVRFEPIHGNTTVPADETVRFEPLGRQPTVSDDATIRFEPVGDTQKEGAEPFSADWEPQYDNPMGEYVPPEPIPFQPRSRLWELKQKLMEGPEQRYYALAEHGQGKLQVALFLSLLVVVLSVGAIVIHSLGWVQEERMRLLVFGELFAMILSALLGSHQLLGGIVSIFKGKFTPDSMLVVSFLVCLADGFFCLQEVRVPFCAAFCLEVTMSLWAEYQRRNTEMGQMDTLRKATRLNRVAKAPDCYEGMAGIYVTDGEVEDFMDTYTQTSTPQRLLSGYCIFAVAASALIAVVAAMIQGVSVGLQTWSAAILAAMPVTVFISQSRPMAVLERRFHKLGVVLCGWRGVKALSVAAAVPLKDTDLFPAGSMKINGVKFYTTRDPDETVAYAAAIMEQANNALTPLFTYLLESRNGIHHKVENYRVYEHGYGGEVGGESVLLGSVAFLQAMGVEIPEGTRVNQAVYASVDGELCAVFALTFGKLKGVTAGLSSLCGYRGLTPVMTGNNFLVTEGFLRSKFDVNTHRAAFPAGDERLAVSRWQPDPERSVPGALTTQDSFAATAFAITGARSLNTCCNSGAVIHMIAGVLGMVMVLILTMVDSAVLTPLNLLIYHLIWAVPGLLISSWTRYL